MNFEEDTEKIVPSARIIRKISLDNEEKLCYNVTILMKGR